MWEKYKHTEQKLQGVEMKSLNHLANARAKLIISFLYDCKNNYIFISLLDFGIKQLQSYLTTL